MHEYVHLERRPDGVAVITIDNGKVNALCRDLLDQLHLVAADLTMDPAGAVVVTGGAKIFAAGADITEFGGPEQAAEVGRSFLGALNAVSTIPRVTIAAIAGVALGGGCELALACDFRVASTRAKLGQPEVLRGFIPGGGGTQRLARLIGPGRAKDLCLSGRLVRAEEALRMGLVDELVEPDALESRALELAATYAGGPVIAHAHIKAAIDRGLDGSLSDGLALEQELFVDVFTTEDSRIGVETFLEYGASAPAPFKGQ